MALWTFKGHGALLLQFLFCYNWAWLWVIGCRCSADIKHESFHQFTADSDLSFFSIHYIQHSTDFLVAEVGENEYNLINYLLSNLSECHIDDTGMGSEEGSMAPNLSLRRTTHQEAVRAEKVKSSRNVGNSKYCIRMNNSHLAFDTA